MPPSALAAVGTRPHERRADARVCRHSLGACQRSPTPPALHHPGTQAVQAQPCCPVPSLTLWVPERGRRLRRRDAGQSGARAAARAGGGGERARGAHAAAPGREGRAGRARPVPPRVGRVLPRVVRCLLPGSRRGRPRRRAGLRAGRARRVPPRVLRILPPGERRVLPRRRVGLHAGRARPVRHGAIPGAPLSRRVVMALVCIARRVRAAPAPAVVTRMPRSKGAASFWSACPCTEAMARRGPHPPVLARCARRGRTTLIAQTIARARRALPWTPPRTGRPSAGASCSASRGSMRGGCGSSREPAPLHGLVQVGPRSVGSCSAWQPALARAAPPRGGSMCSRARGSRSMRMSCHALRLRELLPSAGQGLAGPAFGESCACGFCGCCHASGVARRRRWLAQLPATARPHAEPSLGVQYIYPVVAPE